MSLHHVVFPLRFPKGLCDFSSTSVHLLDSLFPPRPQQNVKTHEGKTHSLTAVSRRLLTPGPEQVLWAWWTYEVAVAWPGSPRLTCSRLPSRPGPQPLPCHQQARHARTPTRARDSCACWLFPAVLVPSLLVADPWKRLSPSSAAPTPPSVALTSLRSIDMSLRPYLEANICFTENS